MWKSIPVHRHEASILNGYVTSYVMYEGYLRIAKQRSKLHKYAMWEINTGNVHYGSYNDTHQEERGAVGKFHRNWHNSIVGNPRGTAVTIVSGGPSDSRMGILVLALK